MNITKPRQKCLGFVMLFYFDDGINPLRVLATVWMGMVWRMILPGPLMTVLKIPSPPKMAFLTLPVVTECIYLKIKAIQMYV